VFIKVQIECLIFVCNFFCHMRILVIRLCPELNIQMVKSGNPKTDTVKTKSAAVACEQCGLALKDKYSLRRHVRIISYTIPH
jgi:hypothetical protein